MYKKEEATSIGKLSIQCVDDSERWFGDTNGAKSIVHHSLAMAGEVGEFCNIVKKVDRGSLSIHDAKVRYELSMELTDVLIYVLNLAGLLGIDLEKSYHIKRSVNDKRFLEERRNRDTRSILAANEVGKE